MSGIWLFSWKTVPEPSSWSLGNCVHCEQLQPIRISDHIKIFSFALLPLSRKIVGRSCCCDFCLHEMRVGEGLRETDLANWLPGEGTRRLFDLDAVGTALCLALACPCIGLILEPLLHAILLRRKIPRRMLARVVQDYGVDPRRIQQLAAGHSRRTQAAARALN